MNNITTLRATHELMCDDLVPVVSQHMLELYGMLGTYSPAGGTPGASCHIMEQRLDSAGFLGIERARRTVLDTGQTSVALFVYLEIDHYSNSRRRRSILREIAAAASFVSIAIIVIFSSLMLRVNPPTQIADICQPSLRIGAATALTAHEL